MKYVYRTGLWTLATVLLVLVFLLALLLYSPKFNHWLVLTLAGKVPELSITQVDGLLLSEIHVYGLRYQAEQADISIESASYRLNLADLFVRQIEFEYLHLNAVNIILLESTQPVEQEPEEITFVMPVLLKVNDFALNDLQIEQNKTDYLIENIKLALLYQEQQVQLSKFSLLSDMLQLQGEAELQLESQLPFTVDLMVEKDVPELANIKGRIQLQGDKQEINLDVSLKTPTEIQAQGRIKLADKSPYFDLQLAWSLLQWPLQGDKQYASENARLTIQGTAENYFISLETDVFARDLVSGKLHLAGQGDTEQLTLKMLTLKSLAGDVQTKGRFSWTKSIPSQLQLLADNIQLAPFLAGYSGELDLQANLSGNLLNDPDFWLEINKLNGKVLDKSLNGEAKIHYSAKKLLIENLQANVGHNSLAVQGVIGQHNAVDFMLDAANLHELSSDLYGSAVAQGSLQGTVSELVAQLELQSQGLKFQQHQLGSLNAKGSLATAGEGRLDLSVKASRLLVNGMEIDKFELQSSGQYAQHDLSAIVSSQQGNLELAMQGGWDPMAKDWRGRIQQLKFQDTPVGSWRLIQVAPLEVRLANQQAIQLQTDLCLAQKGNTGLVCLLAKNDKYQGQLIEGNIKQLPLSIFRDWLPETVQIDSHLQAQFSLQKQAGVQGEINVNLDPGSIKVKNDLVGVQTLAFETAKIDAKLFADKLNSNVTVLFNNTNYIKGQVNVTGLKHQPTANIDGLLNIQLENIGFLDAFIDSVSELAGEVKAQLVLQGLLSAPQLDGSKLQLANGKLFVPEMGLQVKDINIELSHAEQQRIVLQAKAMIDEQQILLDGLIEQYISDLLKFNMALKGEGLQLMQTPEMQVWASPDLRLKGDKRGAKLEGEVGIPKAMLVFESLPAGAVALSDDEVIITAKESAPKAPVYPIGADIKILLGDSVSLEGFGLKTHLQGQLQAVQKDNKLKLFNELSSAKGTYQAYGQDLTIEKGQLLFTGDMENPGVNILASRKASDWDDKTIAYLRMTGTLKDPVTTVYTEPALAESEALAYLLTGAPLGKSDSSNAALYAAAAMSLGRDYIDALMGVVGIDEFDMKSTSLGQNSMVIGKRISTDLYARYIMDVLTTEMQFAVIYKLTENISIETRAGSTHSSDIKYNVEFD